MTSLAQPTHDDQSATECDGDVIERLDDVTTQLDHLQRDVKVALRTTPAQSASNCQCDTTASNMVQLQADVSVIRRDVEALNGRRRPLTNHTWAGKFQR